MSHDKEASAWIAEQIAEYQRRRRELLTEWLELVRKEITCRLEDHPENPGIPWSLMEPPEFCVIPVLLVHQEDQPSLLLGLAPVEPGGWSVSLGVNETQVLLRLANSFPEQLTTDQLVEGLWLRDDTAHKAFLSLKSKIGGLVESKPGQKGGRRLTRRVRVHRMEPVD